MKKHNKPRNWTVPELMQSKGGVHEKSKKALRKAEKQKLRKELLSFWSFISRFLAKLLLYKALKTIEYFSGFRTGTQLLSRFCVVAGHFQNNLRIGTRR